MRLALEKARDAFALGGPKWDNQHPDGTGGHSEWRGALTLDLMESLDPRSKERASAFLQRHGIESLNDLWALLCLFSSGAECDVLSWVLQGGRHPGGIFGEGWDVALRLGASTSGGVLHEAPLLDLPDHLHEGHPLHDPDGIYSVWTVGHPWFGMGNDPLARPHLLTYSESQDAAIRVALDEAREFDGEIVLRYYEPEEVFETMFAIVTWDEPRVLADPLQPRIEVHYLPRRVMAGD